ncbi:MAG: 2-hydroxyacid dehydrogenase [Propionibacteriaceae bacterium]|jgi:phosphoglycerate dehydrogenase-like enzyme|nr:2-hydroxyacid dehydrogenase [Propionibacteriaceae bacterium]
MGIRVWLPYHSLEKAEAALGPLPEGIDADFFLADGDVPDSVGEVEFYVAPYMYRAEDAMAFADQMASLKYVQIQSAGFDDFLPLMPPGVKLLNAAGVHDAATAEMAVSLALTANRFLDRYARNMSQGLWKADFAVSLADRHCLIVGYGHIGKAIAARLAGFEVSSVTAVASRARDEDGVYVHGFEELADLLPAAEVVFLSCPLTPQTEGLFSAELIAAMKPGALLVNVARGKVVDTDALLAALLDGRIRAALDVTEPEPLPPDHPLWHAPSVYITPHCGGQADSFYPRSRKLIAEQLRRLAAGEPLLNQVAEG